MVFTLQILHFFLQFSYFSFHSEQLIAVKPVVVKAQHGLDFPEELLHLSAVIAPVVEDVIPTPTGGDQVAEVASSLTNVGLDGFVVVLKVVSAGEQHDHVIVHSFTKDLLELTDSVPLLRAEALHVDDKEEGMRTRRDHFDALRTLVHYELIGHFCVI